MKKIRKFGLVCLLAIIALMSIAFAACGNDNITFKFVTNGAPAISAVEVKPGAEYKLPEIEWEGHSFEGWYSNSKFTGNPIVSQKATKDMTFYAKWNTMYLVTLDTAGGALETKSFYLNEGDNIAEAVKEYIPTRTGYEFGEWLNGTNALSADAKMPAEPVTLTAHYKVGYTVEIYEQDLADSTLYNRVDNYQGYAYADGSNFKVAYEPEGFEIVEHEGDHRSGVLDENDPSKNVFKMYYNRKTITVYFFDTSSDGVGDISGKYGEETVLPNDIFHREGYMLAGWSKNEQGDDMIPVVHEVYNTATAAADKFTFTKSTVFYAVWAAAYLDIFGGQDYIFIVDGKIYLQRADYLFAGKQIASSNTYTFSANNRTVLTCRVFSNGTFCYMDETRKFSASLYENGAVDSTVTMDFDEYNGIKYYGEGGTSSGTFYFNDDGYYCTHFESGSMVGKDFVFISGKVQNGTVDVFVIRNDEDTDYGNMNAYYPYFGQYLDYQIQISLDGFGYATVTDKSQGVQETMYYEFDDESFDLEILILFDVYQQVAGVYTIEKKGNANILVYFDYEHCGEYNEYDGKGVLTLDGFGSATFDDGTTTSDGYYEIARGATGDTLLYLFTEDDNIYVFSLSGYSSRRYYTQYSSTYSEFYYSDNDDGYPYLIVGNDPAAPNAFTLYAPAESGKLVWIAKGTVAENDGEYTATVSEAIESNDGLVELPFDASQLASFVFTVTPVELTSGEIVMFMFWSSYTLSDDTEQVFGKTYTSATDGNLVITNSYAVYTDANSKVYEGLYIEDEMGGYIYYADSVIYISIDEAAHTFKRINAYVFKINESGMIDSSTYMQLYGTNGADYCVITQNDAGDYIVTKTEGTYVISTESITFAGIGFKYYIFTSNDSSLTFNFISFDNETNGGTYFITENANCRGIFNSNTGDKLELDGYLDANYTVAGGSALLGSYYLYDENTYSFTSYDESVTFLFKISATNGSKTFVIIGLEYGEYLVYQNSELLSERFLFDGKGGFSILSYVDENGDRTDTGTVIATGTYSIDNDGLYSVKYTYEDNNSEVVTLVGVFNYVVVGSTPLYYFAVYYEEVNHVYLNKTDLTVIYLDGFGTAVRWLKNGQVEKGDYYIVSDDIIYYVSSDESSKLLIMLDPAKGEMTVVNYDETGYYTSDFEALLFSGTGIVTYDDKAIYYSIDGNDNVTLYYAVSDIDNLLDGDVVNEYGYVERLIGPLAAQINFDGKTFYMNDGYRIIFTRSNPNDFPIPSFVGADTGTSIGNISFIPGNGESFNVTGQMMWTSNGVDTAASCSITRNGSNFTASVISKYGTTLEFTIELNYHGVNGSTYTVTGMRAGTVYYSYDYIMSYYGAYGVLESWTTYDALGNIVNGGDDLINGTFEARFGLTDRSGNPILSFENGVSEDPKDLYYGNYTVTFVYDNETYYLYYTIDPSYLFFYGIYMFNPVALTCKQTLTVDGYTIIAERVISSKNYEVGDIYAAYIDGVDEYVEVYAGGNKVIYVLSENKNEDTGINTEEHLIVTFFEDDSILGSSNIVSDYAGAAITNRTARLYTDVDYADYLVAVYEDDDTIEVAYMLNADYYNYSLIYLPVTETKPLEDEEGNVVEGSYVVVAYGREYTVAFGEDGVHVTPPASSGGGDWWDDWWDSWYDDWFGDWY